MEWKSLIMAVAHSHSPRTTINANGPHFPRQLEGAVHLPEVSGLTPHTHTSVDTLRFPHPGTSAHTKIGNGVAVS